MWKKEVKIVLVTDRHHVEFMLKMIVYKCKAGVPPVNITCDIHHRHIYFCAVEDDNDTEHYTNEINSRPDNITISALGSLVEFQWPY